MKRAIVLMVVSLSACADTRGEASSGADEATAAASSPAAEPASASIPWRPVEPVADGVVLSAAAKIVTGSNASADIMPTHRSTVRSVLVMPGDRVVADQPVVTLASPELAEAAAALVGNRARLAVLREREKALAGLRSAGLSQQSALFEVRLDSASTRRAYREAQAVLAAARVPADAIAGLAERGEWSMTTPVAGVVTDVDGYPGHVVGPDDHPVVRVRGTAEARVEALLSSAPPTDARARFVGADGVTLELASEARSFVVEPSSGMVRVWVDLRSAAHLTPGLQGRLQYVADGPAVVVPAAALDCDADRCRLRRLRDGEAAIVEVRTVWADGATAVVSGDLVLSDRVAASQETRQ